MRAVGVIGLGIMGGAMSRHLLRAGWTVFGHDISPDAGRSLAETGGVALDSVEELAGKADFIVTSLPSEHAFEAVTSKLAACCGGGHIVIDTSTMPLDLKERARAQLAAAGTQLLDCPVSGTGAQAATGDLVVFGSGVEAAYLAATPVLQAFSRRQVYLGRFGSGSTMKFIANHLVNIHNVAAAEALVLAGRAGLDLQLVYDTLADSAGTSRMFQVRGPLMVASKFDEPTARVDMYMKDLDIITRFAAQLDCPTPLFSVATQLYHDALRLGFGPLDTASVFSVLSELAAERARHGRDDR